MSLRIPVLSYENLREAADSVLKRYDLEKTIPVPIEELVEFEFGIRIIPVPGLMQVHEIDAFTSCDLKSIMVDRSVMESRSPYRYRFSLAHELGHVVLHPDVHSQLRFETVQEWKKAITSITDEDRGWFEYQAYSFAGLLLVPRAPLSAHVESALGHAENAGFDRKPENLDMAKDYICTWVGKKFEVSAAVISKRLDKDALWPPKAW